MWPFRKKSAPAPVPSAPADMPAEGVLFGLNPPEGHHFRVELFEQAWFVAIVRDGEKYEFNFVNRRCELLNYTPGNENCIKVAAKRALADYVAKIAAAELEGCYPPKRTGAA